MLLPRSLLGGAEKSRVAADPSRPKPRAQAAPFPDFILRRKSAQSAAVLVVLLAVGLMLAGRARRPEHVSIDRRPASVAAREVDALHTAAERFRLDCGRYPTTDEGLLALINNPGVPSWRGPYVTMIKRDPWRNRYVYSSQGTNLTLLSNGPDGQPHTADDVTW
jgi:general secretion pathway protein G